VTATIYQQAETGMPSYWIGYTGTDHFVVVHLDGHNLRMQALDADDLDGLAVVLMEAAAALRAAQQAGGGR
jgi:hypothetical protein